MNSTFSHNGHSNHSTYLNHSNHPNHSNGLGATSPAWLLQSVQQFFQGVNWENQSPEIQSLRLAAAQPNQTLSLLLSVNQFFSTFNWDDMVNRSIPVVNSRLEANAKADDFTLDDFSSLF
jgi:hypothetical protein